MVSGAAQRRIGGTVGWDRSTGADWGAGHCSSHGCMGPGAWRHVVTRGCGPGVRLAGKLPSAASHSSPYPRSTVSKAQRGRGSGWMGAAAAAGMQRRPAPDGPMRPHEQRRGRAVHSDRRGGRGSQDEHCTANMLAKQINFIGTAPSTSICVPGRRRSVGPAIASRLPPHGALASHDRTSSTLC